MKALKISKRNAAENQGSGEAAKPAAAQPGKRLPAPKPLVRIGVLVHDVSRLRRTMFDKAVSHLGITRAQWWLLSNLSRNKSEGMNQSELARLLYVGKPTIGGLIDRLVDSGMVERRADAKDRRIKKTYITGKGYELIYQMSPIAIRLNTVFIDGINEKDIAIAESVLAHMKKNLQAALGAVPPDDDD